MGLYDNILYGDVKYEPGTSFSGAVMPKKDNDDKLDILTSHAAASLAEGPASIGYELNRLGDADKYTKVGLGRTVNLLRAQREGNLETVLADSQSNWQKTRNALAQTLVSEIGLGTLKGFSDLFDLTIGNVINLSQGIEQDYENPVSAFLAEKQKEFEEYAPIYSDPNRNSIMEGGLGNWGWWMSNMPSIMSSLTLMIPGEGLVMGASKLGKLGKIGKLGKGVKKAITSGRRAVGGIENAERIEQMAKLGISAGTSRLIENYQEANQVYQDMYKDAAQTFKNMSDEEYNAWTERHMNDFDEGFDFSDKDAVAKNIAKRSATETFVDDLWNGIFDMYELYALKNVTRIMNAPMRSAVRRKHLDSMKYMGKTEEQIKELKAARKWYEKVGEKASDYTYGMKTAIGAELSEGVEEAVNYISQQEGMYVGKLLLEKADPTPTNQRILKEYMDAPELWDSAFWGVLGGVVFQGLGSQVKRLENVISEQTDDRYKQNDKTKEQIKKPSILESWSLPEIKMRIANIEARIKLVNDAFTKIQQIKDGNYKDENGNTPTTESEKEVARRKIFNDMVTEVLLQSQDAGNYDLATEFLTNDNVINFLVDNGITTEENARETKALIQNKIDRLNTLYNKNFDAIDNALRGIDTISGVDLEDMPIEYFKIIARQNIRHELKKDEFNNRADAVEEEIKALEKQHADNLEGKNYREQISHVVAVVNYIEALKSLEDLQNDKKNQGTLIQQRLIKEQKKRLDTLKECITRNITGDDSSINRMARFLSAYQQGRNSLISRESDPARRREIAERYKAFDEAILHKDIKFFTSLSDVFGSLNTDKEPMSTLESAIRQATILNQDLERNLRDKNKFYSEVAEFSQDLANAYARATDLRLAAIMENSMISTKTNDILDAVDATHNFLMSERGFAIENANDQILRLAKEYGSENILSYINSRLRNNRGLGFEDVISSTNIEGITSRHKKTLDDALDVLNLTSAPNINIIEQIEKNLEEAAARDYAEIGEIDEIYEDKSGESSTGLQNPSENTKTEKVDNSSATPPKTDDEAVSPKFGTFMVDKANKPLLKPMAQITTNDDGSFTFSHIDLSNPLDTDVPVIEGENGEIEIDLKTLFEENPSHPIFTNEDVVNLDGNTTLDDDIEVVANPQFIIDDDGNAKLANKGQIRKVGEEEKEVHNGEFGNALKIEGHFGSRQLQHYLDELNSKPIDEVINDATDLNGDKTYLQDLYNRLKRGEKPIAPSSTGGLTNQGGSTDNTDRAAEPTYDPQNLKGDVQQIIMRYMLKNPVYNEDEILELAKQQLEGVSEEDIKATIEGLRNWAKRRAEAKGYDKVIAALDDLTMASDFLDEEINKEGDVKTAREMLDNAFESILNEYAKHCALDTVKVKIKGEEQEITYINLSNLLAYLNTATDNEYTAEVVFQNILKVINREGSKYRILDNNLTEGEYIARAKMSTEELEEFISNGSIQKINLASFIDYLRESIEDIEEFEQRRNEILEAVAKANVGDKLEYHTTDKGRIEIVLNGTVIGSMPIPVINNEGTHYVMINEGWKTDVPLNEGTSEFYNLLEKIFSDEDLVNLIRQASHTKSEDFLKAADIIINKIKELDGINVEELISDENNAGNIQYSNYDRLKHLIKLYNHVKTISEKQAVSSKEALNTSPSMLELHKISIRNWISKLKNSYDALRVLATDENLEIEVANITEGGPIITKELHPIAEAIGEQHKGKVQLAISSITQPGVVFVSGGETQSDPGIYAGKSRIVINSRQSWNVKAIPAKFDSANFKDTEAKKIIDEIIGEFDKILNRWGENPSKTDLKELETFIKSIASRSAGNQPFVNGIRITKNSDENHINLECKIDDNDTVYINFWNKNREGKTKSNVEVIDKTGKYSLKGQSYSFNHDGTKKTEPREKVLDVLKHYMGFNMNPVYVQSDNNRTLPLGGVAKRNKDGKFVIKIGNNPEHIFDSYSDFIMNNNAINVNTMHNEQGSNVISTVQGGNITFKINSKSTSPVEEKKQGTPIRNLGDETLKILERGGDDVGLEIFKLVLNDTQLKNLKNSKILEYIMPKKIIFVKGYNHIAAYEPIAKEINGVKVPAGYVVISDKFIELLNSKSETAADDHMQAIRNLIHESIHDLLTKDDNKKVVEEIREIFDKFVEANQSLPENEGVRMFEYTFSEEAKKRYYTDGKINLKGLEEFLVESLTRPALMNRLNEISQNNRKVGSPRDIKSTRGNLFQRLLSALADLLGIKINKNSLLSKEYEIFRNLFKTSKEITKKESQQLELQFKEETEETKPVTTVESQEEEVEEEEKEEEFNFGDDESFSDILDEFSSSKSIRDKLNPNDAEKFTKMSNNGLINITCK